MDGRIKLPSGVWVAVWLSLALPLAAQPGPSSDDGSRFVRDFRADVVRGCMANAPGKLKNPRGYCTCYASAFVNRFTPQDLAAITKLSGELPRANRLIALMMSPEIRSCRQANA